MGCRWPRITNPKVAILLMTFYGFSGGCLSTYQVSMVSTMEKRFEWPTGQVGWMLSADDIGYLTTVLLVAYYGGKGNQTLVLSLSSVVMFCAACLRSSPFFIFGSKFSTEQILGLKNESQFGNQSFTEKYIPNFGQQQLWAFVIQIGGGILHGVAATPFWNVGLALIDDMGGKDSGAYLGLLFLIRTLSPVCGFLLGGALLKVNENLVLTHEEFPLGLKDPLWIGAWWLGLLVIGGIVFINTPLLSMLDIGKLQEAGERNRRKAREKASIKRGNAENDPVQTPSALMAAAAGVGSVTSLNAAEQETKMPDMRDISLKDLFESVKDLFTNLVFVTMIIGNVFEFAAFVIFIGYFPKYIEYHFYVTANKANMLASIALAGASAVAMIISGSLSKLYPMSMTQMNLYHAIVNTASACLFPLLFLFNCDKVDMIGSHNSITEINKLNLNCSLNTMACPKYDYAPVCIGDKSFMTPCHAGCHQMPGVNGTTLFTDCLCSAGKVASPGVCASECSSVFSYVAVFFVVRVFGAMASVQFSLIMLRLPSKRHMKPLALGCFSFLFGVLGIATPPLAGSLIEMVCLVQNPSKSGRSFCLFYDTDKFRYLMHSVGSVFQVPACAAYFLSYWASRRIYPDSDGKSGETELKEIEENEEDEEDEVVADVEELKRLNRTRDTD